jgi:transposase
LYLIENFRLDWANKDFFSTQKWIRKRDRIRVKTTYNVQLTNTLKQMLKETLRLDVNDHGKKMVFKESHYTHMIFPQEFLALVKLNNKFKSIGWFGRFKMKRLKKASMDNIIILRKK